MKLMKVLVSDLIHVNTSDILVNRYEMDRSSIKTLSNTSGIEESLDRMSPVARFRVALKSLCPECSTSKRWFREAIPVIRKLRL